MSGRPSAGGIKRVDYHRRNRRRNISTRSTSAGINYPAPEKDTEKSIAVGDSAINVKYPGFNENVWSDWRDLSESNDSNPEDWMPDCFIVTSGLSPQGFIQTPPFSTPDEIKRQRFGDNPNDHWWLWKVRTRDDGRIRHRYLEPVKKTDKPPTLW
jgi:hypothetical protein